MRLFLGPVLPPEVPVGIGAENEWNWRSGVDKIRGERQKGCPKVRFGKNIDVSLVGSFRLPPSDAN